MSEHIAKSVRLLSIARQHGDAVALAKRHANLDPQSAHLQFILARALVEAGNAPRGSFHADRAACLDETSPLYAYYAGWLYSSFKLYEFALPLLLRSIKIESRSPNSHSALAECYEQINRPSDASRHYEIALELENDPKTKDQIQFAFAKSLALANKQDAANEIFERLFYKHSSLAGPAAFELTWSTKHNLSGKIEKYFTKQLASKKLLPRERERALLALGKILEGKKEYDRAFRCWTEARKASLSLEHEINDHQTLLQVATDFYRPRVFEHARPLANPTQEVVIICGMPRSGTTLTEQILSSHSAAAAAGEIARWKQLDREFIKRHGGPNCTDNLRACAESGELMQRGNELIRILKVVTNSDNKPNIKKFIEKTPHSFAALGYIKLCCPNARFIHLKRNPLDSFVSTYQNAFNPTHGYAFDQIEYAKEFLWKEQMMSLWQKLFPDNILTVDYEELAVNPEPNARRMVEFVGLEWEDECLEFYKSERSVRTFSTTQVRSPVYSSSIGRWKRYENHLEPIRQFLRKAGLTYN
jgi:tetratricopeptide (TPR) repeat protein